MRRLVVAVTTLTLAVLITGAQAGAAAPDVAPPDPFVLAVDASAFPAGAAVSRAHVDVTAAAADAEGILGDNSANGDLYARLRSWGSLFERASLPSFNGAPRALWLMATVFPTTWEARRAFAIDARLPLCDTSPDVPMPVSAAVTCAYLSARTGEAGMYVVATAGTVEFVVRGSVSAASYEARNRAVRDASYLARHEAAHLSHLLVLGQLDPAQAPAPVVLSSTTHVLCRFSSITSAFSSPALEEQPIILQTRRDLDTHSVVGNTGEVFPRDGFQRGCVQLFDLPAIAGAHHGVSVETDVFSTTVGAEAAFRWWNRVEAWSNPPTRILHVNAYGAPSLAVAYVDTTYYHNTSAIVFARHANVLVALRSWTGATSPRVVRQTERDVFRVAPLIAAGLAQM